jgi:hypothetical protein
LSEVRLLNFLRIYPILSRLYPHSPHCLTFIPPWCWSMQAVFKSLCHSILLTGWLGIPKADANPAFTAPCPGWCTDSNRPDVQMLEPRASLRRTRITQVGEIQCEVWCNMPVLRFDLLLFTCFSYGQTRRKQTPTDWILLFRSLIATFVAMFWSP